MPVYVDANSVITADADANLAGVADATTHVGAHPRPLDMLMPISVASMGGEQNLKIYIFLSGQIRNRSERGVVSATAV